MGRVRVLLGATMLVAAAGVSPAAEITVLSAGVMKSSMVELVETWSRMTGHQVTVNYAQIGRAHV